ncbi:terminase small subunit [Salmonella enterica]|nr:terminase small subunit [Salmonella enterica]EBJ1501927.1 terminase small subunit [Salmonella enterica]EGX5005992.1 terminase small subunit [Salmonella enterica]
MAKLTDKQELFAREFIKDLNATQAAIRAGYSEKSSRNQGARMMANDDILHRIAELNQERLERVQVDADYVLRQAVKLHERCMQEVEPLTDRRGEEIKDEQGRAIYGFDAKGAAAALKLVGEHITVQAFKTNVKAEHVGKDGKPIEVVNYTPADYKAAQAQLEGKLKGLD